MNRYKRRDFLQISMAAAAAGLSRTAAGSVGASTADEASAAPRAAETGKKPMRLGLIVGVRSDPEGAIKKVHDLGVPTAQVLVESFGPETVNGLRAALDRYGIEVTALVIGGPGPEEYDFYHGPLTIGFVPREWRAKRIEHAKQASDFAKKLGIPAVQTHCGFLPENPNDPVYKETIEVIREVAGYCKQNGQNFRYETGQETPITLLRAIQDVGLDNQGVNFDVANLILYGKADPVDAIEVLGPYVQGMHAKDGLWPTDPRHLGKEVPIGTGKVDFPRIIRRLKEMHYQGAVTIEREIEGPQQLEDIRKEKVYLEKLIG